MKDINHKANLKWGVNNVLWVVAGATGVSEYYWIGFLAVIAAFALGFFVEVE